MISIIVTAYDIEDYIEACVNSILNSTYRDYELIIVDDGSTDRTAELCDCFESADKRVHVIHQMNSGVSAARNRGLNVSRGDYITFVDGDDMIHPAMLDVLMTAISSGDYEMSMVMHRRVKEDEREGNLGKQANELDIGESRVLSQDDYVSAIFWDRKGHFAGPCHKLFKRELLINGQDGFEEFRNIPAEDTEWLIRVSMRLNKCVLVPHVLYYYVMRSSSLTHAQSENGINSVYVGRLQTVYSFLDIFPDNMPQYRVMCLNDLYRRINLYTLMAHGTSYQEDVRTQCKAIYKKTIKEYLNSPVGVKAKVKNVVYYHCPWVFRSVVTLSELLAKCKTRCSVSK